MSLVPADLQSPASNVVWACDHVRRRFSGCLFCCDQQNHLSRAEYIDMDCELLPLSTFLLGMKYDTWELG